MFRRKQQRKDQAEMDRFAEKLATAVALDEELAKKYMGGHEQVLEVMNRQLDYDVWNKRSTLQTLHLATCVVRYALDQKDFGDLYGDLKRAKVPNPYNQWGGDLGDWLRAYEVTFGELVNATVAVTEAAGIEGFHHPAMLENLSELEIADEPIDHISWGWQPLSQLQQELMEQTAGPRPRREIRFIER